MVFDIVVLSGGGLKGILELGALHYYHENGQLDLDRVHTFAGTSIGSVISLCLAVGFAPMDIFRKVYTTRSFFDPSNKGTIWDVVNKTGVMDVNVITNVVEEFLREKVDPATLTFGELQKTHKKRLVVVGTNISGMKPEYFTPETHPEMLCIDAIKISCNLPFVFQRIEHNDAFYVDGGLVDSFPVHYVNDGKSNILGVVVLGSDYSFQDNTLLGYFYRLVVLPINTITKLRCSERYLSNNVTLVRIDYEAPFLHFSLPSDAKMEMFLKGFECAKMHDTKELITVQGWSGGATTIGGISNVSGDDFPDFERSNSSKYQTLPSDCKPGWEIDIDLSDG